MKRYAVVGAVTLASWMSPEAHADECGNVDTDGACIDSKTLVWCGYDGALNRMTCPAGEVCAQHDVFDGGFGCIGTEFTDCGSVTQAGECTADNSLVWCDADRVKVRVCDVDTICAWVESESWYDCVASNMAQAMPPDEVIDPATDPRPTDPREPRDQDTMGDDGDNPVPVVTQGGAGPAETAAAGGAGCQGGAPSAPPAALLLVVAGVIWRRRWAL